VCLLGKDLEGSTCSLFKVMFHHFPKDAEEYLLALRMIVSFVFKAWDTMSHRT
jgi:hypothetical protein